MVNAFWQSEIQATSTGTVAPRNFHPGLYDSFYTGRADKKQEVSLTYGPEGPVRLYADPPYSTTGYEVSAGAAEEHLRSAQRDHLFRVRRRGSPPTNPCGVHAAGVRRAATL
ncbi:MAG: hypothetical protein WDN03_14650 [Rhizomicrobium sp.]